MDKQPPKPPIAVALTYDEERPPYVAASGKGLIAEQIIRIAKEHGVLIHEDPALVESLACLELGQEIPENLYKAIAEVISFAYSLRATDQKDSHSKVSSIGE
ncbi:EscU/YscU/HrcU family type III secretion system export apparatus switch protein [Motiliproteus sp. MSK22-1]|uniref:EscU/YscU/HrcU family type III secretion system export apparatus switch protein n=1 Tax=Motiliproteus sp. MSK22-1 TaxID=1897630 RepID=UPI000976C0DE|nr:EscU/YscU/HrcU family type III secretion system export apparatus switch protein [Motiliproteus sp. MSK22-1]OMH30061.1 hypothetical protein BGP75_19210 [Motiliproteus sp. MSK22-1]